MAQVHEYSLSRDLLNNEKPTLYDANSGWGSLTTLVTSILALILVSIDRQFRSASFAVSSKAVVCTLTNIGLSSFVNFTTTIASLAIIHRLDAFAQ